MRVRPADPHHRAPHEHLARPRLRHEYLLEPDTEPRLDKRAIHLRRARGAGRPFYYHDCSSTALASSGLVVRTRLRSRAEPAAPAQSELGASIRPPARAAACCASRWSYGGAEFTLS